MTPRPTTSLLTIALFMLSACEPDRSVDDTDTVIAMGDSILDWNRGNGSDESIPALLGEALELEVANVSVGGSTLLGGDPDAISRQYVPRKWDLVVLDGGGNDIGASETCRADVIDDLVTADASSGAMVSLIERIRADDPTLIVLLGYYGMPTGGPFEPCAPELETLESRYAVFADRYPNVVFLDPSEVVDGSTPADYDPDLLHPSVRGGQKVADFIAQRVADALR